MNFSLTNFKVKYLVATSEICNFVGTFRQIMAQDVQDIAGRIQAKVAAIADRQRLLAETLEAERAEKARLQARVEALTAEVSRLKADIEYLTVVRAVAVTPQQAEQSRALLAEMVREIDRCIAELKAC